MQQTSRKRCTKCKKYKPETDKFFYPRKNGIGYKPMCRRCNMEIVQKWRKENPDRWRKKNTETVRNWRKKHPEEYKILRKRTRHRLRAEKADYSQRAAMLPRTLTVAEWTETLRYFDHRCAYCGRRRQLHQDHLIPVVQGGPYTKSNIVPACISCNSRKGGRTPDEAQMPLRKPWPLTIPTETKQKPIQVRNQLCEAY